MKTYQSHDNTGTPEQWAQYELDKKEFEKTLINYRFAYDRALEIINSRIGLTDGQNQILTNAFENDISMRLSMDAPNVPGYHFANND